MGRMRRRAVKPGRRDRKTERQLRPTRHVAGTEPQATAPVAPEPTPARRPITVPPAATAVGRRPVGRGVSRGTQLALHTDYAAIIRDVRSVGVLAGLLIAVLVALSFVLR